MNEAVREMTFEEEYEILQRESERVFASEKEGYDPPLANCVLRRALRCIRKLQEQPKCITTRREWYQRGYQDGLNADKWIPCSERLPSEYGQYLYTDKNDEVHEGCYCPPLRGMIRGWSTCEADGFKRLSEEDVIAWQPLPQPYKKEGAE